jgi:hypothetical protein
MSAEPPRRKREKFFPEEDARLRRLVERHGTAAWEVIAAELPGRNVRQCRERWKHYLSSERSKAPWSDTEDRLLFEKMQSLGPKWTRLATFFPGRTDIDIKSHWMHTFAACSNLHIKNRTKKVPVFPPTVPIVTGQPAAVQFEPARVRQPTAMPPNAPTPQTREFDWFASRDPSFGSRSFLDFRELGD